TLEIAIVVDLAVEHDHETTRGRRHRLVPQGREVQDGESAEAERHACIGPHPNAAVIGTTVRDRRHHAPDLLRQRPFIAWLVGKQAGYSTHQRYASPCTDQRDELRLTSRRMLNLRGRSVDRRKIPSRV